MLRAAAEPTRVRMLALLARAELTVGEICEVLGQSQPRVSRHLKLLTDAGLVDRLRERHWVYYRVPPSGEGRQATHQFMAMIDPADAALQLDRYRMERVLTERARRAAAASEADPRLSEQIEATVLQELGNEPIGALLDVGTGSGQMLKLLGARAKRAVGVDVSSDALRLARTNIYEAGLSHCELQHGDMYELPYSGSVFDVATVGRVLSRAERPVPALTEIARVLKPAGRLILIDDFDALTQAIGSNPLAALRSWFAAAGLEFVRVNPVDTDNGHWLIALGRRAENARAAA
jgi:DNA-binding transcriptional ArsR family regulator/precorrin-6B methylase 2